MNSLKLYTVITAIFWIVVLYTALVVVNKSYANEVVPYKHVVAVGALYTIYYCFNVLFLYWGLSKKWLFRIIAGLGFFILFCTLFPFMYYIIQEVMPRLDLQLFSDDVPYDKVYFQRRLISAYAFVLISALLTVSIALFIYRRRIYKLQISELIKLQEKLVSKDIKTHFLKNLLSTNFGIILLQSKPEQKKNIQNTIGLLAYFMRIESETEYLVSIDDEVNELKRFIGLLKQYYGEMTVKLIGEYPKGSYLIPLGILLLPLENILKYAKISNNSPIHIAIQLRQNECLFTFKSMIDNYKVNSYKSSGTGIKNMNKIIEMLQLNIEINTHKENEIFVFNINLKHI
ncbi:hypothetical protein [Sphingobacterium sp. SGL-16]|uniref:hypothetical protein n=1 Tax=Sphingobacterium sp. SGL-16 TaxID=2710883 RepID=UPI0013EC6B9B|nr:hypothetical protein [Sphingobacterium sp. SGL-16]NGM72823.1 hypothetical protein [Sphingobacterium sp. SGL-16]